VSVVLVKVLLTLELIDSMILQKSCPGHALVMRLVLEEAPLDVVLYHDLQGEAGEEGIR